MAGLDPGLVPGACSGTSLRQVANRVARRDEWVAINERWHYATAVQDLGGLNAANIRGAGRDRCWHRNADTRLLRYITHSEGRTDGQHSGFGRRRGCHYRERPSAVGHQEILADRDWRANFVSTNLWDFKRGHATW